MTTKAETQKVTISQDLRDYIVPLSPEEYNLLEKSLLHDGCREPLVVWKKSDGKLLLVDGHNRYNICRKHNISFKLRKVDFGSLEEAKMWMINNQIGRRNLTADQASYYRGLKYLSLRKKKGGYTNVESKGQVELSTSEILSGEFNVSESTIKRDAKFAEGLDIIGTSNPKLKLKILTGQSKARKADIQALGNAKNPEKITIRNEADLYNKAKLIKDELIGELEDSIKTINQKRTDAARQTLQSLEPVFTDRATRLKTLKGRIVSATNRAINDRDERAIVDLKKLIDRLAELLFE